MSQKRMSAQHRYSPMKFTKSYAQRLQQYSPTKRSYQQKLHTNKYFCHYQNGIYMGGIDCFKKTGNGIILLDNGICGLTFHSHDNMIDHNIIFRDKSMLSIIIKTNKQKYICYRIQQYLLSIKYNTRGIGQGIGYMVDFKKNKVYKLSLYGGKVQQKQQIKDQQFNGRILNDLDFNAILNDQRQNQCLKFNIDIPGIKCIKEKDQVIIGFIQEKQQNINKNININTNVNTNVNGLLFKLKINQKPDQFDIMLLQRGYFNGDKIDKFGQKHFQNGNYYIGGFKNGLFDGYGLLIHPQQNKWTYGAYKKGQMIDLIQSSINSKSKLYQMIRKIHQYQENYIQSFIKIVPSENQLRNILKSALQDAKQIQCIEDPIQQAKKRRQNLRTIRDDFVTRQYENNTQETIKEQLSRQKNSKYRIYVQGLPMTQKKLIIPENAQEQNVKNKQQYKNQYKSNIINKQIKQKSQNKSQIKPSKSQKKFNLTITPPRQTKYTQKSPIKIQTQYDSKLNKTLKPIIKQQNHYNTNIDQMSKYFRQNNTASSSHRANNPTSHRQKQQKQEKPLISQNNNQSQKLSRTHKNNDKHSYRGAAHVFNKNQHINTGVNYLNTSPNRLSYENSRKIDNFDSYDTSRINHSMIEPYRNTGNSFQYFYGYKSDLYLPLPTCLPTYLNTEVDLLERSLERSRESSFDRHAMSRYRHFKYVQDGEMQEALQKRLITQNKLNQLKNIYRH